MPKSSVNETEHYPGDPEYHKECAREMDESTWIGRGHSFPEKVVIHHLEEDDYLSGNVKHVYRREK
jgi:hypothetical protein